MKNQTKPKGNGTESVPSFYPWQFIGSQAMDVSPDIIHAVLDEDKTYTLDEARKIVDEFLKRKA